MEQSHNHVGDKDMSEERKQRAHVCVKIVGFDSGTEPQDIGSFGGGPGYWYVPGADLAQTEMALRKSGFQQTNRILDIIES